jgi:hypothetical protein
MGFEPTIPVFERAKAVHAFTVACAATVIGIIELLPLNFPDGAEENREILQSRKFVFRPRFELSTSRIKS